MSDFWYFVALIVIGIVTGTLTGLTGGSGMSFLISGLLFLNSDIRNIIGLTFVVTLVNSIAALPAYIKSNYINVRFAINMGIPAILSVFPGHLFSQRMDNQYLIWIVVSSLFLLGIKMTFNRSRKECDSLHKRYPNSIVLVLFGVTIGFLIGIFGGGGGAFIGVLLILLFHISAKEAVGVSILLMAITSVIGLTVNASYGRIELKPGLFISIPSVLFAFFTSQYAEKVDENNIKKMLGIYLLVMSIGLFLKRIV